jgi:ComF family protein
MSISTLLRRVLNAAVPTACAACRAPLRDDPIPFFCRACWGTIQPIRGPVCPRCGYPFASTQTLRNGQAHLCGPCRAHPPAYTQAWSLYAYVPPLQKAIHLFKYQRKVGLAGALGRLLHLHPPFPPLDMVMPVPLHPVRLKEREYNQSLLLADHLNERLALPLSYDNLVRVRQRPPQTELTRRRRLKNLRRAFSVMWPGQIDGKRILLVDDVLTTGTTVNECAKTLRKAGAADVYVITLARTL